MLVVVPARGGSRRIPGKNLAPLAGRPLLAYTLDAIAEAGLTPVTVVSTDDAGIGRFAREQGVAVISRPAALATDTAATEAVLLHALESPTAGSNPEWVVTLPPTNPFRRAETIRSFVAEVEDHPEGQDCLFSVHEHRGDFWRRDQDDWQRLTPGAPRRQQDRNPLYEENSAIYVTRVAALRASGSILGPKPRGRLIPAIEGFDINAPEDLVVAAALLASRTS